jgi:3-oxoacyl-[acyl-carrier-protein] synthase II
MISSPPSIVSIYFGLHGEHHSISSACASSASAIGHAYLLIRSGMESIVLCGGSESMLCYTMMLGWNALRVLAQHDDPKKASRPFDRARNGLVMGEGAGMIVLESRESAERRGVPILAKVAGYAAVSDAYNITAPRLEGQVQAIRKALGNAGIRPADVDYVNAHGTSTQANDAVEAQAFHEVFGSRGNALPISSTKSMMGHSLGACAAQEFIACVHAIRDQFVPPTINLDEPDPDLKLDLVPHRGREHPVNLAMSTSFAFGGNNSVILVQRFEP